MAKSKEELEQLRKEYESLTSKLQELSEDELKSVGGGTSHSSDTYDQLGVQFDIRHQVGTNHPVITTLYNSCNFSPVDHCKDCQRYHSFSWFSGYCKSRSKENDPAK